MVAPTPELSDDTPIERVLFSIRIQNALKAADLKTVGEVREVTGVVSVITTTPTIATATATSTIARGHRTAAIA
jgi:Bacterial RNA polymerase, alpha chain C terminal domain